MSEIVLSHPGICLYPLFVGLLFVWALRNRPVYPSPRREPPSLRERRTGDAGYRISCSSDLRGLRAYCTAEYRLLFEKMNNRIKFRKE